MMHHTAESAPKQLHACGGSFHDSYLSKQKAGSPACFLTPNVWQDSFVCKLKLAACIVQSPQAWNVQAGSIQFLSGQGFDFNKMIKQGIPFLQASLRDR